MNNHTFGQCSSTSNTLPQLSLILSACQAPGEHEITLFIPPSVIRQRNALSQLLMKEGELSFLLDCDLYSFPQPIPGLFPHAAAIRKRTNLVLLPCISQLFLPFCLISQSCRSILCSSTRSPHFICPAFCHPIYHTFFLHLSKCFWENRSFFTSPKRENIFHHQVICCFSCFSR